MVTTTRYTSTCTMINGKNKVVLVTLVICWGLSFCLVSASPSLLMQARTNATQHHHITEIDELFHWEDYTVLAIMLIGSCAIGVFYGYFGEKQTTGDDFLLGGSTMGTFPMALSLAASFITAIELLGNPAEMYIAGSQFWMTSVAFILVVPITSQIYLPVFMKLRLTSCYEYLEIRFCKPIRLYASSLYMMQMILYTAVAVYAPALALSDVTGLNTYLAVSVVYLVCIFYASQGGMKAVIITDTFQTAVLLGSLFTLLGMGAARVGGLGAIWDYASKTDRLHIFDMNPDPTERHTFWTVVVGGTMYWTGMFCANQASVQKYLSVERISQVRIALWVSGIGLAAVYTINFITGALLATHYATCDPLKAGIINESDRLLPLYVVTQLGWARGVPGFFVAGIFAASLGTVAAALNSLAALACQDLITGVLRIHIPENKGAMIARWVSLGCGALSFALVFVVERLGPVLQLALSFNGMTGGVSLGLFTLGMVFPWSNVKGAAAGGVCGLFLVAIICVGAQIAQLHIPRMSGTLEGCSAAVNSTMAPPTYPTENQEEAVFWLFRISYLWYSGLGCVTTVLVGLLVSILTGVSDPAKVPIDLLSPPIVKLLNSLPNKVKKCLRLPMRVGSERRGRSLSEKPTSDDEGKDTRRRRRLSAMAGGVFYNESGNAEDRGQDNQGLRLDSDKLPPKKDSDNSKF